MKQEYIYDYLIPTTILERKKHQKKLDEIKVGKTRRNISFFQSEDVRQNQKIKKTSFNYRQQEQQMNLYKQNTKMFFKLLNISTNSNFSTIPQLPHSGGLLSNQNKSQQKINIKDITMNNDILVDLNRFDKNSQLEQVLEEQKTKLSSSGEQNGINATLNQRQSLNTQNRKRNSVSPTNATQNQSILHPSTGQIQPSNKQTDFLDKIYKENLVIHQRLLDMDSVLSKRNFDKFHTKQSEYKNRLQKFQVDQSTQKVKIKCGTYVNKFTLNTSHNKSREDVKRRDGRQSTSPNNEEDTAQQVQKTEETITIKENGSGLKNGSQKEINTYPKSFFTEIDQPYSDSTSKLNNLRLKNQIKSKTRDQSLIKTVNKGIYDSQGQISNQRKHPSQIEIGVQSYLRNSRPKTNNTINGNGRGGSSNYHYHQRAHTTSHSDQNDTLASNALRDRSMQDLKNRSGDSYLTQQNNIPTLLQSQKMDNQFKNFFSTSARSVSAKRNQSLVRNNLNTNIPKKNLSINESKIILQQQHQQIRQNNIGSTRNANNNYQQNNGYKNNPYIYYSNTNNNNIYNNHHSLNNSHLTNSNNNSFNKDLKNHNPYNNQQLRNNFITTDNSYMRDKSSQSNQMSKSAIHDKADKQAIKNLAYTPQQINNDPKLLEEFKKQSQEMYKQYKISFEQISPYSTQHQQNVRRRVQTVHHNERKNEYNQPQQKQYPRIQREKLVPLTQVKEEDHLQQTLDANKGYVKSTITIPEKISL